MGNTLTVKKNISGANVLAMSKRRIEVSGYFHVGLMSEIDLLLVRLVLFTSVQEIHRNIKKHLNKSIYKVLNCENLSLNTPDIEYIYLSIHFIK